MLIEVIHWQRLFWLSFASRTKQNFHILYVIAVVLTGSRSHVALDLWLLSSVAGLQPAELVVWVTDVWMNACLSSNFFKIATPPTVFVRFLWKLAWSVCQYETKLWERFSKFWFQNC